MTFTITSHEIGCIVQGNGFKLCQVSVHKLQLYTGGLGKVHNVSNKKSEVLITKLVLLKIGPWTCKMMSVSDVTQT